MGVTKSWMWVAQEAKERDRVNGAYEKGSQNRTWQTHCSEGTNGDTQSGCSNWSLVGKKETSRLGRRNSHRHEVGSRIWSGGGVCGDESGVVK